MVTAEFRPESVTSPEIVKLPVTMTVADGMVIDPPETEPIDIHCPFSHFQLPTAGGEPTHAEVGVVGNS